MNETEQPKQKPNRTGFYLVMALLLLCLAAYAGTPFFVKKVDAPPAPKVAW